MTTIPRRAALAAPLALAALRLARAQAWRPSGQMRILVNAAPGGTTDIMGRMLAAHLQQRWGTPVVVENKGGGGGTIASAEIARAAPDMLNLLSTNIGPSSIAYSLFRNLPYRPESFQPVSNMIRGPNVLVVHPSVRANTVAELIALLREQPGKLTYGTAGVGQSPHLSAAWFHQLTNTQAVPSHYRGSAPAMLDLLAGNTQFMFDNLSTAIPHIRGGRVRALAVTSAERNQALPDLPAMRETMPELAEYEVNTWFGIMAPAGVPADALRTVNLEIKALLEMPATVARFAEMGGVTAYGTPEEFDAFIQAEIAKWGAVVRREGVQLDFG
ncbi:Bug family tripartite tricarboxylate transporter substrate binding protein [Sabulicella rubraurantiaca]|uniref:Bug family tripartite tricarboxylate transporter substrate binding protein n=1 Tax=Sabulicella rubraurantiaca TaxID=2811429 RepID=UPI001A974418|nr:tripartite tricarboxylate transporter substrate binding protein [Sabulicella rubraurantiaca]